MASLSEEMKSKRDVKRKSEILIIDKDLGNFGLYKAILAMEYVLECAYNIDMAKQLCRSRRFDVIVADGEFAPDDIEELFGELHAIYGEQMPELLVMVEADRKDEIIRYLCIGAKGCIPKPFSKEGMTNAIYEVLHKRRRLERKHSIVLVDDDFAGLKAMKSVLEKKYIVNIINDVDIAKDYITKKNADLLILDVSVLGGASHICDIIRSKGREKNRVLFLANTLDEDIIASCWAFNPEGILMKPVSENELMQTVEKIFLRQSYVDDFGNR